MQTMDSNESYTLHIDSPIITIRAAEVWGVLHALETLAQLCEFEAHVDQSQHHPAQVIGPESSDVAMLAVVRDTPITVVCWPCCFCSCLHNAHAQSSK